MRKVSAFVLSALAALTARSVAAVGLPGASPVIQTDKGPVQGLVEDGIASYKPTTR